MKFTALFTKFVLTISFVLLGLSMLAGVNRTYAANKEITIFSPGYNTLPLMNPLSPNTFTTGDLYMRYPNPNTDNFASLSFTISYDPTMVSVSPYFFVDTIQYVYNSNNIVMTLTPGQYYKSVSDPSQFTIAHFTLKKMGLAVFSVSSATMRTITNESFTFTSTPYTITVTDAFGNTINNGGSTTTLPKTAIGDSESLKSYVLGGAFIASALIIGFLPFVKKRINELQVKPVS